MQTDELKKLLKGSTAVLILEDGEPSFVILGYDAYKDLLSNQEKEVKINHPAAEVEPQRVDLVRGREGSQRASASNGVERQGLVPIGTGLNERQHRDPEPSRRGSYGAGRDSQLRERISEKETELLEKINKQILSLKNEITEEEKTASSPHIDPALEGNI